MLILDIRAVPWLGSVSFLKRPPTSGPANPLLLPLSAGKGQMLNRDGLLKGMLKQRNWRKYASKSTGPVWAEELCSFTLCLYLSIEE